MSQATLAPRKSKSKSKPAAKPEKLTARGDGRWQKKVRGKFFYFSGTEAEALSEWSRVKDDILAGREPAPKADDGAPDIRYLVNSFLTYKAGKVATRELSQRTLQDLHFTCERIVSYFGKTRLLADIRSSEFAGLRANLAKKRGLVALGNEVVRIKSVFNYGYKADLIDKPIKWGIHFDRPSADSIDHERNRNRQQHGQRMLEAADIRKLLKAVGPPLKAMILLGVNCGFGQSDIANLPKSAIDLEGGWINFPRPKTAVQRRCPLWPETVQALREALAVRPAAKDPADDGLAFLTWRGQKWVRITEGEAPTEKNPHPRPGTKMDALAPEFATLLKRQNLKRSGLSFYALRHGFETTAGESIDQVAVNHIMGHKDRSMSANYRERISDDRLRAVVDHVRGWLFTEGGAV